MYRTREQLDAALPAICESPRDQGTVELIVCRPAIGERTVLEVAMLDAEVGLVGDTWRVRGNPRMPDNLPHPEAQVTLMNARVIAVVAGERERWPLAGDQLYVDLDLGLDNLAPGTRLHVGDAVLAVTQLPHTGCAKFLERFGPDALRWISEPDGRMRNLRGINARVVVPGRVRRGDRVHKLAIGG